MTRQAIEMHLQLVESRLRDLKAKRTLSREQFLGDCFSQESLMAPGATQKAMKMGQRRSAGGSPVAWVCDGQESTAGPAALQRFS